MFKEPKIRVGNKNYSEKELEEKREASKKARHKRYNKSIRQNCFNIDYTEFYHSKAWNKARKAALLRDNYMCQRCLANGVITNENLLVHHKTELKNDWSKRLELKNLETVCFSCHNKIHKK
ncbi:MAG: HNH endonuclease [Tetragenococcus koreensis]|nr:HNH endonuclease [Tetragenococcus koreensis]